MPQNQTVPADTEQHHGENPTPAPRSGHGHTAKQPLLQAAPAPLTPNKLEQGLGHRSPAVTGTKPCQPGSCSLFFSLRGTTPAVLTWQWAPTSIPTWAIFSSLNFLACKIKTLEGKKPLDFSEVLPLGRQTSAKLSQEWQSMKAEPKCPESPVTPETQPGCCILRDCKTASMKLPDGEIKKTILRQHPDNMQSTYIETIINLKNTG